MKVYKKLLLFGLAVLSGVGSSAQTIKDDSGYFQVFDVTSSFSQDKGKIFFENDTIKVTFQLWGDRGNMQISIQNKLDKPIYMVWDKSTYTNNGKVFTYTPEKDMTRENSKDYKKYLHEGRNLTNMDEETSYQFGEDDSKSTVVEMVTEVKPKGYYMRNKYHLIPDEKFFRTAVTATETQEPNNSKLTEKVNVFTTVFDTATSPLKLATSVVYATTKDNPTFHTVNGNFWVTKITEVPAEHFKGEKTGKGPDGAPIYKFPLRKSSAFWVEIKKMVAADRLKGKR